MKIALTCIMLSLAAPSAANVMTLAGRIPIVWGKGETISDMGALDEEAEEAVNQQLGGKIRVGFHYRWCHLFFLDLWTWDGKYVLYEGDRYWELPEVQWEALLEKSAGEQFGVPFLYRFPLMFVALLLAGIAWQVKSQFFPSEVVRLGRLMKNSKFRTALETVLPENECPLNTEIDETRYEKAIHYLTTNGVSYMRAHVGLDRLLHQVCTIRQLQFKEAQIASQHWADAGLTSQSIQILERLLVSIPESDPRHNQVVEQLEALRRSAAEEAPDNQASEREFPHSVNGSDEPEGSMCHERTQKFHSHVSGAHF